MKDFDNEMEEQQKTWRYKHIESKEQGKQGNYRREWILPAEMWEEGLWEGIRSESNNSLPKYLQENGIQKHTGSHNLKSSWILCANLYFPFRTDLDMITEFLVDRISGNIENVKKIELEWAGETPLDPATLLGEPKGKRGSNQTSPDVAFVVKTVSGGKGIILTESKFTEHSFYTCSGRQKRNENPDISRCMNFRKVNRDRLGQCYQMHWQQGIRMNRKYWSYVDFTREAEDKLKRCPAATAGYQLFRQQSLAEALMRESSFDMVASCVAYDCRNEKLISCLSTTGIDDFREDWAKMYNGKAIFTSFSHQEWYKWVNDNDPFKKWAGWSKYIRERYGFSGD